MWGENMSEEIPAKIILCINFAAIKHRNQRRKDKQGTPYINHPIGVAKLLIDGGITDLKVLQAAMLHDTIEDTNATYEELCENFGERVADIVMEVSDDKSLPKKKRKEMQIVNAQNCSIEAKLVKLADKLYNLKDLERGTPKGWTGERVKQYIIWASKVCKELLGTNTFLESELREVFNRHKIDL